MPCAAGLIALANPILQLIYPSASSGAQILILSTITMIFVSMNYVVEGRIIWIWKNLCTCNSTWNRSSSKINNEYNFNK